MAQLLISSNWRGDQVRRSAVFFLVFVGLGIAADYLKLANVKRIEKDLYSANGYLIETQYCYHYAYGESATLKWEGPAGPNKIIWDDNQTCDVTKLVRR